MPSLTDQAARTAAIYCRVSTSRQEDEGTSLDTQEERCRAYAGERGYRVSAAHVFRETHSGADLHARPKLAALRNAVRAGEVSTVVCFAVDRLSRNQAHLYIVAEEVESAGARLDFVTEQFEDSAVGKFLRSAKAFAAEVEREKTKERTLRGKRARVEGGKVASAGGELYGYRKDRARGVRVPFADEAAIVRQIYQWVAYRQLSIRGVVHRLRELGIDSPAAGKRTYKAEGRAPRWGHGVVRRILEEPSYKGEAYAWRWKRVGKTGARVLRPESEWVRLPEEACPPLVTRELWDAVQQQLASNRGEKTRNAARPYLLRGVVRCAVCGRAMRSSPEHGRRTYRCSSRETAEGKCGGGRVAADQLEAWAWGHVAEVLRNPSLIAAEVERRRAQGEASAESVDRATCERKIAKLEKDQERLLRRYREADEDDEDGSLWELVQREITRCKEEKKQQEALLAEIDARVAAERAGLAKLESIAAYCARVRGKLSDGTPFERKREALEAFGVRVYASGSDPGGWWLTGSVPLEVEGVHSELNVSTLCAVCSIPFTIGTPRPAAA